MATNPLYTWPALLTITVKDDKGAPIANATIVLFAGAGDIQLPENFYLSGHTDANGNALMPVDPGFYRIGIFKQGYVTNQPSDLPPIEWRNIYSAWGTVQVQIDTPINSNFTLTTGSNPPPNNMIMIIGAGAVGFGLLGLAIWYLKKKRKT